MTQKQSEDTNKNNKIKTDEYDKKSESSEKSPSIWSMITLEPLWLGVFTSMTMCLLAYKDLSRERACLVDLGYTKEVCFQIDGENKTLVEREVQKIISSLYANITSVAGLVTCLILIFLGPWSDTSGRRKPLMIISLVGMIITSIGTLLIQVFPNVSAVYVVCIEKTISAITGDYQLLAMAAFNHLGDICYKTERCMTTTMGSNIASLTLASIIGSLIEPFVYRTIGFIGLFGIATVLELISLIYVIYKVEDIFVSETIPSILDISLPLQAFKCVFKKRNGKKRRMLLLMISVACFTIMTFVTERSVNYLHLRNVFAWTELEYGIYFAVNSTVNTIGTIFIIIVFKRLLHLRDNIIGVIGGVSQLIFALAFMFSRWSWLIYTCTLFGIFSQGTSVVERSIINKQIVANEQGKINSVKLIGEKIIIFVLVPFVNKLYNYTLDHFASIYMIVSVAAAIFQIIAFSLVVEENENGKEEIGKGTEEAIEMNA